MSKRFVLVVIALVTTGVAAAKWLQVGAPAPTAQVRVTEQSNQGVTFEVTVPGIEVSAESRDGRDFSRVTFPGGQPAPLTVGRPEVPMIPVLLAVPNGARVSIHVVSVEMHEFKVGPVLPLQPPMPMGQQPLAFAFDKAYYAQDECYPVTEAAVRVSGGWHGLAVVGAHVYPVQVNPGRGTIDVAARMVVRADFSGGTYPKTVTGWMIPMYARLVANWPELDLPPAQFDASAHEYLAIVTDRWSGNDSLNAMLQWINRRGYRVRMEHRASFDTIQVKQIIKEEYDAHDGALRWVLLVGTPEEIPTVLRYLSVHTALHGDYAYSDFYDGDHHNETDCFPEVGIGRICTNVMSQEDIYVIAVKIMAYQRDPKGASLGHEYDWLSTIQVVSHREDVFFDEGEALVGLGLGFYDFTRHHIAGSVEGTTNQTVVNSVNAGTGSLIYTGHGLWNQWAQWSYSGGSWTSTEIDNMLHNGPMTPVVVQLACDCSDIATAPGNCISESWIAKSEGGAVATMGEAELGWIGRTDHFGTGFLLAIGDNTSRQSGGGHIYWDPRVNLGDIMMLMVAYVNLCSPGDEEVILPWLLLGDPSMPVWTGGAPKRPLVTYPHVVPETRQVPVSVTVDGAPVCSALVCLSQPGSDLPLVLDYGRTDRAGKVTLDVPENCQGNISVTVTEGHVREDVQEPGGPRTPILPFTSGSWYECAQVPAYPSGEYVKDGGWLDFDASGASGNGLIYAAKGRKVGDFYSYNRSPGTWNPPLKTFDPGVGEKLPDKGCRGVSDGNGCIYMTQGNNTLGFWRYDAAGDSWHRLANVLEGDPPRRVKGGTDLVFTREFEDNEWHAYVYLLKGGNNEFHRYDSATDVWTALAPAPANSSSKYKAGSFLAYDGNQYIYAHQARYNKLYRFDMQGQPAGWSTDVLNGMPFVGRSGRSKKSKDGGCGVWMDGCIWALKGGNTQEFWQYDAATQAWAEMETIPKCASGSTKKKLVTRGGDITNAGGTLFAFKGGKTREMWRCALGIRTGAGPLDGFAGRASPLTGDPLPPEYPLLDGEPGYQPRWSPQGDWGTYTKEPVQGQSFEQVFMAPYGLQQSEVQLTDLPGDCESPSFSPNGQRICFAVFDSGTERMQIAKVPATSIPQPVVVLTSGNQDKWNPVWSPSGQAIVCQGDDASGSYSQLWLIPADSGPAVQLTSGPCDREEPSYLNATEILYLRSPANGDDQLYKLNLVTMQETPLTYQPLQPERPCPSYDGSFACYQAQDDAGIYQIGLVSSFVGGGHFLTGDVFDQEEPDASPDNVSIHSVRWVGLTSQICRVDAVNGGFVPITDANAIRDNPDSYWNPTLPYNLVVYEREDTNSVPLGFGPKPKQKRGTGVFLARSHKSGDGQMAAGHYVLALERAEPNPATNRIRIRWQVPVETGISLRVYNTAGQLVKSLADGRTKPGAYTSVWNGTDTRGRRLAAGVYFYTLDNGEKRISRKLVLTE